MSSVTGKTYRLLWAGSLATLGAMIRIAKLIAPQPDAAFPPWQGMQYMRDQFSGRVQLTDLANGRYPGLTWTSVRDHLAKMNGTRP